MNSQTKIRNRIQRRGRGFVFSATDFADLGSRAAVGQALSRLARTGKIRRLDRGTYDFPQKSHRVGMRSPDTHRVAKAAVRRLGARLQCSGAMAAHSLGLSDQVPVRAMYLTDAPSRIVKAGKQDVTLKHAGSRALYKAGSISGDVHQALRFLGRDAIDDKVIAQLRHRLTSADKKRLIEDLPGFVAWVQDAMRRVAAA